MSIRRISEFERARILRLRNIDKLSITAVARLTGIPRHTVRYHSPGFIAARNRPTVDVALIRRLRYRDGLSSPVAAAIAGCCPETVRHWAPGRPGKIDNTLLRQAFDASDARPAEVARRLGWQYERLSGPRAGRLVADGSRVLRTLGLREDPVRGFKIRRRWIDAETACLIADAIGVPPDVVGACDDLSHLATAV